MTPADIDAVLPRVATWPPKSYDLTDPDERAEAVAWLDALFGEAFKNDLALLKTALMIAADRTVTQLTPYAVGMCGNDLQRALRELYERWNAADRAQTPPESPETPETEEVPQWAPTAPESTGNGEEGCTVQIPWGPPKPGTHETDVVPRNYWRGDHSWAVDPIVEPHDGLTVRGGGVEMYRAERWSKEHA